VLAGTADIALVGTAGEPPPGVAAEILISEGLAAVVPPEHPLTAPGIPLRALTSYPLVTLPRGTGIRGVLDQACAAAGLRPNIVLEASAPGAVADLGARGMGVAVLSRSMAAAWPRMRAVPIDDIAVPAVLALIWRRQPTPAVRALLPHCRHAFETGSAPGRGR
jgi:DNA-binding transcriptional LysR family regulator